MPAYRNPNDPNAQQTTIGVRKTADAAAPQWGAGSGTGNDQAVQEANTAYNAGQRGADPNKVAGYSDRGAWDKWYASQAGGKRPEDMQRFSTETLAGWDQYLNKSGENAGKYRSMRGAEGYFDKPTECPPGQMPSGPSETDPCIPNSQAGGGAGGAGGSGGSGGGGGSSAWDNPIYQYLKSNLMDPNKATETFMGQGGSAAFQNQMDSARKNVEMMPPGPARDAALARLEEQKASGIGGIKMEAEKQRMAALTGQMMPQEYGYVGLGEQARQANQSNATNRYGMNLSNELGWGNLGLEQNKFADYTGAGRTWQGQQSQLDRDLQMRMQQNQIKSQQPSGFQKVMGGIGSVVGLLSDIRLKENILPEDGALSALESLPIYSYNYTFDSPSERHLGVMAQDVEKISPHLVLDADGYKAVDLYGLLAVTMGAVKDLSKKVNKIKRGK